MLFGRPVNLTVLNLQNMKLQTKLFVFNGLLSRGLLIELDKTFSYFPVMILEIIWSLTKTELYTF